MSSMPPVVPWYRQLWPWLLISLPASAVVAGFITLWLAATTNNSLVVDDYYKEGKAINLQLARDRVATQMGLTGTLSRAPDGTARLELAATGGSPLPDTVTVRLVHATRAEQDMTLSLQAVRAGVYAARGTTLPQAGRWNVHVEDPGSSWRLVGI
ncbi:MAG TPA: FixH family protein, partial [Quisquiliibacterium sp.]|nr:FixH family protein [Quisquiliibacterium sp.]